MDDRVRLLVVRVWSVDGALRARVTVVPDVEEPRQQVLERYAGTTALRSAVAGHLDALLDGLLDVPDALADSDATHP